MKRNMTARQHNFATLPRADVPRSKFRMRQTRKQAFDASDLIPIMCEEVLPGDVWQHRESIMARLATPIAPVVDDLDLETWYFFIPNRITAITSPGTPGDNANQWEQFITGQVSTTIPLIGPPEGNPDEFLIPVGSVFDHYGIPPGLYTVQPTFNALPFLAYFMIHNEWFRDQNLQEAWNFFAAEYGTTIDADEIVNPEDVPISWDMMPLRVNKRSDYFTRSLPFAQKGAAVSLPLGAFAPVVTSATDTVSGAQEALRLARASDGTELPATSTLGILGPTPTVLAFDAGGGAGSLDGGAYPTNLQADLASATSATINAIRLASITQQILERDARGGSRYVEQNVSHWAVRTPDFRLQRPEYLGGSRIPITVNPIAQTAAYDAAPSDQSSPVGNLGAEMHASGSHRTFTYSATEHGYIIGLCAVRATPTYQQGVRRHWIGRNTRLNYYFPLMANLGEQPVDTKEIYYPLDGSPAVATWGYQEFAAEMRYTPNEITGVLRSQTPSPLDWWHYAEEFENEPALNAEFITDKTKETLARSLATDVEQWSAQIIMDVMHDSNVARLMPAYSVPGIDRF